MNSLKGFQSKRKLFLTPPRQAMKNSSATSSRESMEACGRPENHLMRVVWQANTTPNNHIICQVILNWASLVLKSEIPVKCFQETQEALHVADLMMGMWIIMAFSDIVVWMLLTRWLGTSSVAQALPRLKTLIRVNLTSGWTICSVILRRNPILIL